jgi:hypothetical protein
VTTVVALTAVVETGKLALVAPSGTVTVAGTDATPGLLLDRNTPRCSRPVPGWRR